MKYGLFLAVIFLTAPQSAPANTPAFAHCGTYDSYILLYKSVQKFEELGKLHCGESLEITGYDGDFAQVRTTDGRLGWVPNSDLASTAPPPQNIFSFGWTERPKPEAQPDQPTEHPVVARVSESAPLLTNVDVMKMQGAKVSPDAIISKLDHSRCDFDMAPAAVHRLKLSGVSDRIILAMMHAPAAFSSLPADAPQTVEVSIPNQTAVQVALSGDVLSEDLPRRLNRRNVCGSRRHSERRDSFPPRRGGACANHGDSPLEHGKFRAGGVVHAGYYRRDGRPHPCELCRGAERQSNHRKIRGLSLLPLRIPQRRAGDPGFVRPIYGPGGWQHPDPGCASFRRRPVRGEAISSTRTSNRTDNRFAFCIPHRGANARPTSRR